ncbi:TonB-dependent receptor [Sphingomonas sp.]|jgi:iron complex outermembrane receptor protein|uniref:TonB-dependent receptor domain-containing protein n=1 Tax=Sphingomonas sp. TaxID=28214 RepID=UPI00263254D2|nr:TonB-dependent receptor [Sphingomonas sp.]MDF2496302.1 TonB-dependent receptor [Sphingomonas sp.]
MIALAATLGCPALAQSTSATNEPPSSQSATSAAPEASIASGEDAADIVVTGSLIRGTPRDAALPVDVFSSETLRRSGINSPLELIKQLPSTGTVLGDSNQFNSTAQSYIGVGSINLRNLGASRTLVLLNSRRTIATPGTGFVDTNLLPLFALERVEVLKDGAATTYGSDAIAGVVNFITRDRFEGVEVQGDYTGVRGSDDNYTVSLLAGKTFGRVNLYAGFGYQHRSELETRARGYTQLPYGDNPAGYSSLSNPGTFILGVNPAGPYRNDPANVAYNPRNGLLSNVVADSNCASLGGTLAASPTCFFSYVPYDNIVEDENRYQAFGRMTADLTDTLRFRADVLWARTDLPNVRVSPSYLPQQGPRGPGTAFGYFIPQTNPGFAAFQGQTGALFPGQANASTPSSIAGAGAYLISYRPFATGGNPAFPDRFGFGGQVGRRTNDAYRISAGFDGQISSGINFDVTGTYNRSTRYQQITDIVSSRLQNALEGLGGAACDVRSGTPGAGGCQYFNPFSNAIAGNPALGLTNPGYVAANANDPALVAWMFEKIGYRWKEEQFVLDAVVSGKLFQLGGRDVSFAVGGQYRTVDYSAKPLNALENQLLTPCPAPGDFNCSAQTGPLTFIGLQTPVNASQSVYAILGELNVPVTERINVQLALRREDYGGGIGSTTNPKANVRWELLDFLTLRGSVGTTFRGPLPSQTTPTRATTLVGLAAVGNNNRAVDLIGNPSLSPEKAFNWSTGGIVKVGGLTLTADYYSIRLKDKIISLPGTITANSVAGIGTGAQFVNCASPFRNLVVFGDNNTCVQGVTTGNDLARVISPYVNGSTTNIRGLDMTADLRFDALGGKVNLGANASVVLKYEVSRYELDGVLFSQAYNALGYANYDREPGTMSRWRGNGYVNYAVGPINARYNVTYIDGVEDNRYAAPAFANTAVGTTDFGRTIRPFVQQDVVVTYDLDVAGTPIQLQGAVINLFDRDPSAARLEYGYDPFVGNPLGRTWRLGMRATF